MGLDIDAVFDVRFIPRLKFGRESLACVGEELRGNGLSKCLLVTDSGIVKAGFIDRAIGFLKQAGLQAEVYAEVEPNPGTRTVGTGLAVYSDNNCDCLLAVGGGSSIDTAKAIGILATNGGGIMDYEGMGKVAQPIPYLAAVPTTYGSGSETTAFAVITDEQRKFKAAIGDPKIIPSLAIIDPELMVTLPREIGAAVGIDALCHAIESYTSRFAQPFSRAVAFQAIRLICKNIEQAVRGDDLEAVLHTGLASAMAGMAFSQSRLGLVHAMAHPLGGHYDIPHGIANAVLLAEVMKFNAATAPGAFAEIAEAMGVGGSREDSSEAASRAIEAVRRLQDELGIPRKLSQLGIGTISTEQLAKDAMLSGNVHSNPREATLKDVVDIYGRVL